MKNHVKRLHLGEDLKKTITNVNKNLETLQCEHCGKDYSSPSALATHVKVQHEHVTYNCDRCGKMFRYVQEIVLFYNGKLVLRLFFL